MHRQEAQAPTLHTVEEEMKKEELRERRKKIKGKVKEGQEENERKTLSANMVRNQRQSYTILSCTRYDVVRSDLFVSSMRGKQPRVTPQIEQPQLLACPFSFFIS